MSAAAAGLVDVVQMIFDAGGDLDYADPTRKNTALMLAAKAAQVEVCEFLIQNGANAALKVIATTNLM